MGCVPHIPVPNNTIMFSVMKNFLGVNLSMSRGQALYPSVAGIFLKDNMGSVPHISHYSGETFNKKSSTVKNSVP